MATGSDWLLDALATASVDTLFGNPGSTELPLVDALGRQDRVRYVLGLHEHAVIGMADGYAQGSGQVAVANVHVQPGMANALAGVLNAARSRVPLVVTVGQQHTELRDDAPFLGGPIVEMAAPLAKAAWEVERVDDLPETMSRALRAASTPPTGPVVVSLPLDVQAGPAPTVPLPPWSPGPGTLPDRDAVTRAARVLASAERPVVIAGDGAVADRAGAEVLRLAERLGAPVHGEPFACRYPVAGAHPLWAGPIPGFAVDIRARLAPYDVVVAIGMPVFRLFGTSDGSALPDGARLVHIEVDPAEIGRSQPTEVGVAARPAEVLRAILDALGPAPAGVGARRARLVGRIAADRAAARAAIDQAARGERISGATLTRAVAGAVGPRDVIVEEGLTSFRLLRAALTDRNADNWLAHRGSALGWGLPAAVGTKLARPDRRVLCLHGDGSLLFGVHALWTAARYDAPVGLVVADNGGYEILRAGLEGLTGRQEGAWPGIDVPGLDVGAICRGFGASAARVDAPGDLPEALDDLWRRTADGPAALVVRVEGRTPAVGYPLT